ncbi:efflux RND transporter periplasmic adaptor subunit [Loktanella sp. SALINAS62]|uniref:efflux RND transporter periplasmic adaptor subunit n=1 Tax=Loktanella sp. SALINAS62 TaxID=2706124 RepID=UPI001B8AE718|nr:efflux RND transporter periplasmic adaptor subunit [Loktanella sp. SALINAS62]MBS1303535.1 efflux RND transporter periplasmic adaptor subunit [Loktanella sp. SALINAS62]
MRIISILIATAVAASLYFLVLQRDTLMAFAGREAGPQDTIASTETSPTDVTARDPIRVVALRSTAQVIENAVVLRGRTEAARQVTVATETTGKIIGTPQRKGQFVSADDILCTLDPGTRTSALAEAQARLSEARSRVPEAEAALAEAEARRRESDITENAARSLSVDGFASDTRVASAEAASQSATAAIQRAKSSLTAAQAGIESAAAAVDAATREIERLTIRAPFGGLLETDTAELGTLLRPGDPCGVVVQLDPIKVVGFVPELDVSRIAPDAPVRAALASGVTAQGRVTFIARAADPVTRTFRVEATVPNPDLAIRDGETADITIATEGRTAHLVPQSALTLDNDGALGLRLVGDGDRAVFTPVTLLRDTGDGVWLTGLDDTADIITVGQDYVVDGVPIAPSYVDPSQ